MPALCERPADIPLLVAHFAAKHGERFGRPIARIDRRSMAQLEFTPGLCNVRELQNVVERAVILSRNGTPRVERDLLPGAAHLAPPDLRRERRGPASGITGLHTRIPHPPFRYVCSATGAKPSVMEQFLEGKRIHLPELPTVPARGRILAGGGLGPIITGGGPPAVANATVATTR